MPLGQPIEYGKEAVAWIIRVDAHPGVQRFDPALMTALEHGCYEGVLRVKVSVERRLGYQYREDGSEKGEWRRP